MPLEHSFIIDCEVAEVGLDDKTGQTGASAMPHLATGTIEVPKLDAVEPKALRIEDVAQLVHDFKHPLATIALEAWLLDEKVGNVGGGEVRRTVARINHNLMFLDRMVQDLLDSCAIDRGLFTLHRRAAELRALLEQAIERVATGPDQHRVLLEACGPVTLSIDDLRIERVMANLISNALKYGSRGTAVVIRLEREAGRVRISVIDAGPGLTEDELSYVFDEYRRAPSAHASEGSGLGLYASKRIIEAHGGRIAAESTRGVGSRFYFELPVV